MLVLLGNEAALCGLTTSGPGGPLGARYSEINPVDSHRHQCVLSPNDMTP